MFLFKEYQSSVGVMPLAAFKIQGGERNVDLFIVKGPLPPSMNIRLGGGGGDVIISYIYFLAKLEVFDNFWDQVQYLGFLKK